MIVEKRKFHSRNPVTQTGSDYEFHRTDTGYFVYESVHRGRGFVNNYGADFYTTLPSHLEYAWDKATAF